MDTVEARTTIESLLRGSDLPRPEAELLLRNVLGCERIHLLAHGEEAVDSSRSRSARAAFSRRRSGEPVSYIIGRREFYGLTLHVTSDVLIPRTETERLVELALERLPAGRSARVLELGTGSGAIALALATYRPELKIVATDVSEAALAIACCNAHEHGVEIEVARSDWFESIGPAPFDLIVSNPPYVAAADAHLEQGDVRFEPRLALVGGVDGLDCIRVIAARARERLQVGGWLLLEHGYDQMERCIEIFRGHGYADVEDFEDLARVPRVCAGRWRGT